MILGPLPVVNAVIARLQERLPAALAAQLAANGGDVPLPSPVHYRRNVTADESEYPVVFVLAGRAEPMEQTGRWLTNARQLWVVPELRYASADDLGVALMMYEAAIMDAVLEQHAPAPAHALSYTGSEPSPVFLLNSSKETLWQSWVEVGFRITMYEEDRTP